MTRFYCVACKKHTQTRGEKPRTVSKRNMLCGICVECGNKKCTFVASEHKRSHQKRSTQKRSTQKRSYKK